MISQWIKLRNIQKKWAAISANSCNLLIFADMVPAEQIVEDFCEVSVDLASAKIAGNLGSLTITLSTPRSMRSPLLLADALRPNSLFCSKRRDL